MPNISPPQERNNYLLYNNKIGTAHGASDSVCDIQQRIKKIGYEIVVSRGDPAFASDG
jgi:biotin synthase